jgi:hypothetical protein
MKAASGQPTYAEALVIRMISRQLRVAWDDVVQQDLPASIQLLVHQLERSEAKLG